jgi:hypothetical protein
LIFKSNSYETLFIEKYQYPTPVEMAISYIEMALKVKSFPPQRATS